VKRQKNTQEQEEEQKQGVGLLANLCEQLIITGFEKACLLYASSRHNSTIPHPMVVPNKLVTILSPGCLPSGAFKGCLSLALSTMSAMDFWCRRSTRSSSEKTWSPELEEVRYLILVTTFFTMECKACKICQDWATWEGNWNFSQQMQQGT